MLITFSNNYLIISKRILNLISQTQTTMTVEQIKSKGVLYNRQNGCEMYLVIGKWNNAAKKADHHWYMISEKTGIHMVTTLSNRMDERVSAHWKGFKQNQN